MRKIAILFFILFFSQKSFAQQNISELTANYKEAKDNFGAIYDLNVFKYYDLNDYNSDLKREVFKKTQEYQDKLSELKSKKSEMLKTTYYTTLEEKFSGLDYDMKRKGFEIKLGSNMEELYTEQIAPKSIKLPESEAILFKALPTKWVEEPWVQGMMYEKLFFPMNEEAGLEIENDKTNIDIYFFFTPTGREQTTFKYYGGSGSFEGWHIYKRNALKADKVRVVVANKVSGKIYFDKTYSSQVANASAIKK